ncbi:uncharacterized protein LOC143556617 [Bidens hawaiensis]|uniref:uncharacterized protein LOC143556617 n=1 Tax=Bidens hawaiensis TaxID=980011 RepID=UPI00404B122D
MDTRKKTTWQFQQDKQETFAKFHAMFEKLFGDFRTLQTIVDTKQDTGTVGPSGFGGGGTVIAFGNDNKPYLKLHFPRFSDDDPTSWLYQAERSFDFQRVPDAEQTHLASLHLDGVALKRHKWYTKSRGPLSWIEFTTALLQRFGPTDFEDPLESLSRLKQTTTVSAFQEAFERLSHHVDGLPGAFLLGCFIDGLKDEIRLEVKIKKTRTLSEAIGPMCLLPIPSPPLQLSCWARAQPLKLNLPAPTPIRRISHQKARERREKGPCYYCDRRYTPGRKCSKPQIFMIKDASVEVDDPDEALSDEPPAEISFHAITGTPTPQTLRLPKQIKNKDVVILVDGGSTHNFIDQALVNRFGLTVDKDTPFKVVIANSDHVSCLDRVHGLTLTIQGYIISTDFFVLPVAACPVVLGIQWLKTLGPIEIDYEKLTLGFHLAGSLHKLQGLRSSERAALEMNKAMAMHGLGLLLQVQYLGHLISVQGVALEPSKVQSILSWPTLKSSKGVRGFLGLAGYYRKFIKGFRSIAAPLHRMVGKGPFVWNDVAEYAFQSLKLALTTTPTLGLPDWSQPFTIECDASGVRIGANLLPTLVLR